MANTMQEATRRMMSRLDRLKLLPEVAISAAEKSIRSDIPGGWSTYSPAIEVTPLGDGAMSIRMTRQALLEAAARLQAQGGILRRRYGKSSEEYIYWDRQTGEISSEPYPLRVEAAGAPAGTKDPGAGQGVWARGRIAAREAIRAGLRAVAQG